MSNFSLPLSSTANALPLCQRCEVLPAKLTGPGTLHLRFPLSHSLGKILAALRRQSWRFTENSGTISIEIDEENLAACAETLSGTLTVQEQQDVRTLFRGLVNHAETLISLHFGHISYVKDEHIRCRGLSNA